MGSREGRASACLLVGGAGRLLPPARHAAIGPVPRVAAQPERYDVIVTLNLYGDILSDIAAQVAGSIGLAGSTNVGRDAAMFEAVHGSAPDIAGRGIANPSGLLVAATQMLVHVGLAEEATTIKNAWLRTLEDGIHTADVFREGLSRTLADTDAFTGAVIERLGSAPAKLEPIHYSGDGIRLPEWVPVKSATRTLVGVDVFLGWAESGRAPIKFEDVPELLSNLSSGGLEIIKTENLYADADGGRAYSRAQGE